MADKGKFTKKLLVEGPTDMHVVLALCKHHGVPENFDIVDCGGVEDLFNNLKIRLTNPSMNSTIGIMVDADNNIMQRFNQIIDIINNQSQTPITKQITANGVIIPSQNTKTLPNIGIWLMPDNVNLGMIEDFAISLIPQNDNMIGEVEDELKKIEDKGINRYSVIHHSKAKIHTYLSWQEEPGSPIGLSITKKVLNPDQGNAKRYVDWLVKLFSL